MNALFRLSAALAVCILADQPAQAQSEATYPSQPIRVIVPYTPGGLPDVVARILGSQLQERLGQSVVVENRPGGAGSIAVSALTQAPADGYTLMITDGSTVTVNPILFKSQSYSAKDIAAVSLIGRAPLFLAVSANVPASSLQEFVAYVKSNPSKINYGSSGLGSPHHISMESMKAALGLEMTHVPFRGSGPSVQGLLGGHIEAVFAAYPSLAGAIADKRVKLLATNGATPSLQAPEAPPIATLIPGFNLSIMVGLFVRAGTPADITRKIESEVAAALKLPNVRGRMEAAGLEPTGDGSESFARHLAAEISSVSQVIASAGIRAQ